MPKPFAPLLGAPRDWAVLAGALVVLSSACTRKIEPSPGPDDSGTADEAGPRDATPRDSAPLTLRPDLGLVIHHDAGAPVTCASTCECPQGLACLGAECRTAGVGPVFCCENEGCPTGQVCLDRAERPSTCPMRPDAGPDAGPRDIGQGVIGASCQQDLDCDQTQGFSCWEQGPPPNLWGGYCTLENCSPVCPGNSACITFNGAQMITGCMRTCITESDCRSDAFCFPIPGSTVRICLPDCRDDLFDCSPRDGTEYCNRASGMCEPTPMQTSGVSIGDPCADSRGCGPGQICMGEQAWGLVGGMCSQVCSGLPEATPCGATETCQTLAGIGLCFANCIGTACPNRANAVCSKLATTWPTSSCIPQ